MWDDDDGLMRLGQYVRQRRKALGLTQTELGARLGWSQERVSVVERGTYGLPSLPQLVRLASALQVPISEMLSTLGFGEYTPELADGPTPHLHMRRLVERITMLRDGVLEVETRTRNAERQLADAASLCREVRTQRQLMAELLSACRD